MSDYVMPVHTPGPWSINEYDKVVDTDGETVQIDGVALPCSSSSGEYRANGRLVAAAPELLKCLEGYMDAVERMNEAMKDGVNVQGAILNLFGWLCRSEEAVFSAKNVPQYKYW